MNICCKTIVINFIHTKFHVFKHILMVVVDWWWRNRWTMVGREVCYWEERKDEVERESDGDMVLRVYCKDVYLTVKNNFPIVENSFPVPPY